MSAGHVGKPRVQRRRDRNRQLILDVAERIFASAGYANTRIESIAEGADLAIGTLYTHFDGKDGVFLAVAERILDRAEAYIAMALNVSTSPLEQTAAIGRAYLNLQQDFPFLVRFMTSDAGLPEAEYVKTRSAERIESLYAVLANRLEAAIAAGEARSVDARLFARYLVGSWNGVCAMSMHPGGPAISDGEIMAALDEASRVILDGLTSPSRRDTNGQSPFVLHPVPRPTTV